MGKIKWLIQGHSNKELWNRLNMLKTLLFHFLAYRLFLQTIEIFHIYLKKCFLDMPYSRKRRRGFPNQSLNWMDLGNAGKWQDWLYDLQRYRMSFPSSVITQVSCFWLFLLISRAEGNGGTAASFPHPFKHSTALRKEARVLPSTFIFLWEVSFSRYSSSSSADIFPFSFSWRIMPTG